jgi:hypothetical protein
MRNAYKILVVKLQKNHLEDLGIGRWKDTRLWTGFIWLRTEDLVNTVMNLKVP